MAKTETSHKEAAEKEPEVCFVIMPISDPDGFEPGHFAKVYRSLIAPACVSAGYRPVIASEVKATNLIHVEILRQLVHAPMAICDLSSHNPNVMFELALRQAFDKPVVLIQDETTKSIFDIAPMRYSTYRKRLQYLECLEDQQSISQALLETAKDNGVQSIVKLMGLLEPAKVEATSQEAKDHSLLSLLVSQVAEIQNAIVGGAHRSSEAEPSVIMMLFLAKIEDLKSCLDAADSMDSVNRIQGEYTHALKSLKPLQPNQSQSLVIRKAVESFRERKISTQERMSDGLRFE